MHTPWPPTYAFKIRSAVGPIGLRSLKKLFKKINFLSPYLQIFDSRDLKWDLGMISPLVVIFNQSQESMEGEFHFNKLPGYSDAPYPSRTAALRFSGAQVNIHQSNYPQSVVPG